MMTVNTSYSQRIPHIHGKIPPEPGQFVGYTALTLACELPLPDPRPMAFIADQNHQSKTEDWLVFPPRYQPEESLYKHLVFALKYEGVNLLFFKKLFEKLSEVQVNELLDIEPTGQYSRKIWFLYEWLIGKQLDRPDLKIKNPIPLVDEKLQYAVPGVSSPRHRTINNLPGHQDFCPLIRKTQKLQRHQAQQWGQKQQHMMGDVHHDLLQRAAAFLLLKDSKASFNIEGENPSNKRAQRWGDVIGQAGIQPLSKAELLRLQEFVIVGTRFTKLGFRDEGGFIGAHDRLTGEPIPDHISARWEDLDRLIEGLIGTERYLQGADFDPVLAAAMIAFGFVFIHPFVDGNGRIHRYLIHHLLSRLNLSQPGIVFPVSAAMLNNLPAYRRSLEAYSRPLLKWIDWQETDSHNVAVLNNTIDYYRYFDATTQAEYLYDCVQLTVEEIIPQEVRYLQNYEAMKQFLDKMYDMPDKTVALLIRFLDQNEGKFSKRALENEFSALKQAEIDEIEQQYQSIFHSS